MNKDRINSILKNMSLEDKARQLTQINADFVKSDVKADATGTSDDLKLTHGDIFGAGSGLNFGGAVDALAVRQQYISQSHNTIPLVMMQDVIHGYRTIYPIPLAVGCSFDLQLAEDCAYIAAVEAKYNGVDVTFSPMVDLARDARWGRVMESTGEDHYLNGEFGKAFIRGYHRGGIGCCVKHFAGYGAAEAGRDYNTTDISERSLKEYYLYAYRECLKEKPELVMTSFNLLNGVPVNADSRLLLDILRGEMGFDGVVVSDYGAVNEMIMHGYAADKRECARTAANNEIDLEMMSSTYVHNLPGLVKSGEVSEEKVNKMTERMLALKEKLGLFDNPLNATDEQKAAAADGCAAHRGVARRAAEKSCVLLKNNGVLPLNTSVNAAYIGPFAEEKSILGAWACAGRADEAVSIAEGVEKLLCRKPAVAKGCGRGLFDSDDSGFGDAVKAAAGADVIIACIGEYAHFSGESASRADIRVPGVQIKLLKRLKELNKPIVSVVFGGRPLVLTDVEKLSDAVLYVWQPGSEGGSAIANLIYGRANPSGKLVASFPRSVGQCPVYYNHFRTGRPKGQDTLEGTVYTSGYIDELNAPLYPFGYGLSYSRFEYSGFGLSSGVMRRGDKITARVTVENKSGTDGEEVVQLYICDKFASAVRPVKELKAFKKIYIPAGGKVLAEFEITEDTLAFYTANGSFNAESGDFDIMAGGDSVNVLTERLKLI